MADREPRHEFYETDEWANVSIFDKGASPEDVSIAFSSRSVTYEHGNRRLILHPLTGEINPDASNFTIGKYKVEVRLAKTISGRWTKLVGGITEQTASPSHMVPARAKIQKNWEGISEEAIKSNDENTNDDPNAGGDKALNSFFQKLFADADDDTKKAMMKSYQESGGTTLSTNWAEVGKKTVQVKPPEGSEWRKWG